MNLRELSHHEVVTVEPQATVAKAVSLMKSKNVGAVVVVNEGQVAGILTDRDVALRVIGGEATADSPVSEVMTQKVLTIWEDQGVFNATQYLLGHKVRRLPIIDRQDRLVGMVTLDDLFGLFAREMFNVAKALEPSLGETV